MTLCCFALVCSTANLPYIVQFIAKHTAFHLHCGLHPSGILRDNTLIEHGRLPGCLHPPGFLGTLVHLLFMISIDFNRNWCNLQGAVDTNGQPINVALYRTFWGLQLTFQKFLETMQPAKWSRAAADIKTVLSEFDKHPIVSGSGTLMSGESDRFEQSVVACAHHVLLKPCVCLGHFWILVGQLDACHST